MSTVMRGRKNERPSWDHANKASNPNGYHLEMLESIRNVCEQIRDELSKLNDRIHYNNFMELPRTLRGLRRDFAAERKARRS